MHIEAFREYCLQKPGVTEGFPFGGDVLVFKVMDKMFALMDVDAFESVNLKCDPDRAAQLREQYDAVQPGYHMSKKHWNTVLMDGSIADAVIYQWVDDSYDLVVASLPKKIQQELKNT